MTVRARVGGPRYRLVPATPRVAEQVVLTPEQRAAVDHRGGPLLVLAGPGTGKTTTIVETVASRVADGVSPDEILVLTFSRRAAVDLRRRVAARLGRSVVTPRALTFHAFCYAVVRRFGDPELYGDAVRLLTAPEQDFRVREVLSGLPADDWPAEMAPAYGTRGFATEVRSALATARQLGLDGDVLQVMGEREGRPEWEALGRFFDTYLDVLEGEQVLDYAELVHRTRVLLADPAIREQVQQSARVVLVDEYQDTDPSQVGLLRQLVPPGGDLVVVGDPDQSIYEFRGARPRAILDFPQQFTDAQGAPARVVALSETRRFGTVLAAATRRIADRLALPRALPDEVREAFRRPRVAEGVPPGVLEVHTYENPGAEAEHIADLLRRAHLHDGVAWSDMAVLVRSGRHGIPRLSRALVAAGVPVEVAGDEIALGSSEAVKPLLLALSVAVDPSRLDSDSAAQLLLSPLGGLDSIELRRLGRLLRDQERAELGGPGSPRPSGELVWRALADPDVLADRPVTEEVSAARALAGLLQRCGDDIARGATAHEALWGIWRGTSWPARLQTMLAAGGDAAGRAHRDLDAICALFDVAERSDEVTGGRGVTGFLQEVVGQEIPADTARESQVRNRGVRVLTAHRSKGLEWPLVVVAGVQEGTWPDPRRRGSLLEADRWSEDGTAVEPPPTSTLLAAERRLFYVACTRATRRLVVTAVSGTEGEGDQPSRFLAELGVEPVPVLGRPARPLTLTGLVGELRRTVGDAAQHPAARLAAARRLAALADAVDDSGEPLVPAADPARWWGTAELSPGAPVAPEGASVRLSGSQVGTLLGCPRQWFLARRAAAEALRTSSASFGSVVHVLAEHGVRDGLTPEQLSAQLERVWDDIPFDAVWFSASERAEAEEALERLAAWSEARSGREVLGVEVPFEVQVRAGEVSMTLTGTVDRLDRDSSGRLVIVDFKTGRSVPTAADAAGLDQLGVYQLAATMGAFDDLTGGQRAVAGGELVYLRRNDGEHTYPKVLQQPSIEDTPYLAAEPPLSMLDDQGRAEVGGQEQYDTWVHQRLAAAGRVIAEGRFDATVGNGCSYCPFASSCPARSEGRQVIR